MNDNKPETEVENDDPAEPAAGAAEDTSTNAEDNAATGEPALQAEKDEDADVEAEPSPEEQIRDLKDQLLRALAEAENTRRRAQRDKEDTAKYAITNFARDVLAVSDNLARALEAVPEETRTGDEAVATLIQGLELTQRELQAALERHSIRQVDPLGEKFDHNLHQAMFEVESDDAEPGTVVQVVQLGYVIGDRLLRPAMVGVAKKPVAEETGNDDASETNDKPESESGSHIDTKA